MFGLGPVVGLDAGRTGSTAVSGASGLGSEVPETHGDSAFGGYVRSNRNLPWRYGSQPPLLSFFINSFGSSKIHSFYHLSPNWNLQGLGHHCQASFHDRRSGSVTASCIEERRKKIYGSGKDGAREDRVGEGGVGEAIILHWTGPNKPWMHLSEKYKHGNKVSGSQSENEAISKSSLHESDAGADHDENVVLWSQYSDVEAQKCWTGGG